MSAPGWSLRRLTLVLYPFGWGAMAVNLFFASLIGAHLGLPVLGPGASLGLGALVALPATRAFARHIRHLIDKAEEGQP